jgi:Thioredoxin-like
VVKGGWSLAVFQRTSKALCGVVVAAAAIVPGLANAAECDANGIQRLPVGVSTILSERLLVARGERSVRGKLPKEARYAVLAYGARWCGPCHVFTRQVRPMLEAGDQEARNYAYIFVSLDRSESEMLRYGREERMNWLMIPPSQVRRGSALDRLAGVSIPSVVVVDLQTSQVICQSAQQGQRYSPMDTFSAFRDLARQ